MRAAVTQTNLSSPTHDTDASFSFPIWVGTIGGSALPTDPDPNVTPPSAGRILRISPKRGATVGMGALNQAALTNCFVIFGVVAGSSITVQFWYYDDTQARWVPVNVPLTRTPVSGSSNIIQGINVPIGGCKMFVQITANTNVQAMAYEST